MAVQPYSATAPIKALSGSQTSPGITFTGGDTDTGIYSPAANQVGITTGGTQRLLIGADGTISLANNLSVPLATASSPSIYFGTDTNTGIYSPGPDTVAISTNGTGRLFVDSNGNVGVGTTSPGSLLELGTSTPNIGLNATTTGAAAFGLRFQAAGTTYSTITQQVASGELAIKAGQPGENSYFITFGTNDGTEKARITADGKVGLGTSSPSSKLEIRDDVVAVTSLDTTFIKLLNGLDGGSGIEFSNAVAGKSKISFGVESSGVGTDDTYLGFSTCSNGGALTERVRIDSSGRVGIGTTDASSLFSSDRNVRLSNTSGKVSYEAIVLDGTNNHRVGLFVDNSTGDLGLDTGSTTGVYNGLSFYIEGSKKATIDRSGRLLVGTSSDSGGALLQVNGDRVRIATAKTPASASDTGTAGEICWDANYIYVCTATDTWKRTAISTW